MLNLWGVWSNNNGDKILDPSEESLTVRVSEYSLEHTAGSEKPSWHCTSMAFNFATLRCRPCRTTVDLSGQPDNPYAG